MDDVVKELLKRVEELEKRVNELEKVQENHHQGLVFMGLKRNK